MSAKTFGKYELGPRLAAGGMAITYRAKLMGAKGLAKQVVLKLIHPHLAEDPEFAEMFIGEAQLSATLSHGNIAQVFDFGEVEGQYFIAMEFVQGQSLAAVLKRAKARGVETLPQSLVMQIGVEMCEALHYAHTRADDDGVSLGIVHRDVSPENVLISHSGEVKLIDFGIAKSATNKKLTETGMVKGKFPYFSPEQARAQRDLDGRTDLYATGVVLYECLCGRRPYEGEFVEVMRQLVDGDFPMPRALNDEISPGLEIILLKALAHDRAARYRTTRELGQALAELLHAEHPQAHRSDLQSMLHLLFAEELAEGDKAIDVPSEFRRRFSTEVRDLPTRVGEASGRVRMPGKATGEVPAVRRGGPRKPGQKPEPAVPATEVRTRIKAPASGVTDEDLPPVAATTVQPASTLPGDETLPPVPNPSRRVAVSLDTPELREKRAGYVKVLAGGAGVMALIIGVVALFVHKAESPTEPVATTALWVTSVPTGATVMVDDKEVGKTPFEAIIPNGPHTIGMALAGYRPWSLRKNIASAQQIPIEGKLVPVAAPAEGAVDPSAPPKLPELGPITATVDAGELKPWETVTREEKWPFRFFSVSPRSHVLPVPERATAHFDLDPRTTYMVSTQGALVYGHGRGSTQLAYFLEGDVPEVERFGILSGKPRPVRGATRLHAFLLDDDRSDNSGKITVIFFKTKLEPDRTMIFDAKDDAIELKEDDRLRLSGLNPSHEYLLTFRNVDARLSKGVPAVVVCQRAGPRPEPLSKNLVAFAVNFRGSVTGITGMDCLFVDTVAGAGLGTVDADVVDVTELRAAEKK